MLGQLASTIKIAMLLLAIGWTFSMLLQPAEARWVRTRALPVTVGLWAAGMLLPNLWLMYALIAAAVPLAARNRGEVPASYIVAMTAVPSLDSQLGGLGVYFLSLDRFVFGAIGLIIAALTKPKLPSSSRGRYDLPFWLAIVPAILPGIVFSRDSSFTSFLRSQLDVVLAFIAPYLVVSRSIARPAHARLVVLAFAYSGFVMALVAVYEAREHWLIYDSVNGHFGLIGHLSAYAHVRSGSLRAGASFVEATSLGIYLATCFLAISAIPSLFRKRLFWLGAHGAVLLGLYAANARSALISVALGTICFDIYRRRFRLAALKAGAIAGLGAAAVVVAQFNEHMAERLGLRGGAAETADYRTRLAVRGWEEIRRHPLFGVGPTGAYQALSDLRQGEGLVDFVDAYVFYGVTSGLGGMLALFLCFTLAMRNLANKRRLLWQDPTMVPVAALVYGVLAYTVLTTYTSGFGNRNAMLFYVLLATGSALGGMRIAADRPPVREPARATVRTAEPALVES